MDIIFPYLHKTITLDEKITISEICKRINHPLNTVCNEKGNCGKCLVTVIENGVTKEVLGCIHPISDSMQILISPEDTLLQMHIGSNPSNLDISPLLSSYSVPVSEITESQLPFQFDTIRDVISQNIKPLSLELLVSFSEALTQDKRFINFILDDDEIIDLFPDDQRTTLYGIAFDIGTTSIAGYLYNLTSGVFIGQNASANSQSAYGADVISRIEFASESPENLQMLQTALITTINAVIVSLCNIAGIETREIRNCIFCGNTTMQHLLLGLNPVDLGIAPFVGIIGDGVKFRGKALHLDINPKATAYFMPLLGGFVGADTTAMLLTLPTDRKKRLVIDLGTNGEIAVGNSAGYFVTSTACGPALEGGGIVMGMNASSGAIEHVQFTENGIHLQVIGDIPPKGFCGSGIIDAVACLLNAGLITDQGAFIDDNTLRTHPLGDHIRINAAGGRYFVFTSANEHPEGKEIVLTQKDIRAVQMAKAAIFTGCQVLMTKAGITGADLSEILIAGAFGNYIDIENAQTLGIIPSFNGVPARSVGNAAGAGAQRYLLSREEAKRCDNLPEITTHIDLATDPAFYEAYIENMRFGCH